MDEPPTSPVPTLREELAPRPAELDDLTLGLLDAGRPGSADLLARLAERLAERHFLGQVVPAVDDPETTPAATVEQMAAVCHVVIGGLGDDEESVRQLVEQAIALERRRIPAAVLVVRVELEAARALAATRDFPALAVIPVDCLVGDDGEDQRVVRSAVTAIERALCSDPAYAAKLSPPPAAGNGRGVTCAC